MLFKFSKLSVEPTFLPTQGISPTPTFIEPTPTLSATQTIISSDPEIINISVTKLRAPGSDYPAAGVCQPVHFEGNIIKVYINADTTREPRCALVVGDEKLKFLNVSNATVEGEVGGKTIKILPGESLLIDTPLSTYLETKGVHIILGAEFWFK